MSNQDSDTVVKEIRVELPLDEIKDSKKSEASLELIGLYSKKIGVDEELPLAVVDQETKELIWGSEIAEALKQAGKAK